MLETELTTNSPVRPFYLGFTPFPADVTDQAVQFAQQTIRRDGDIVAHHFDDGVPWVEAYADQPYPPSMMANWAFRRNETPPGHSVYLAITPIRLARDGLALYRGETGDMPLPAAWADASFNDPMVKAAYLHYATTAVDYFDPDYLAIGLEVNLLMHLRPDLWRSSLRKLRE